MIASCGRVHGLAGIYRERLTTPGEAMKAVRSGDTVMIPIFPPVTLALALAARRDELKDVTVRLLTPAARSGWLRTPDESTVKGRVRAVHRRLRPFCDG